MDVWKNGLKDGWTDRQTGSNSHLFRQDCAVTEKERKNNRICEDHVNENFLLFRLYASTSVNNNDEILVVNLLSKHVK